MALVGIETGRPVAPDLDAGPAHHLAAAWSRLAATEPSPLAQYEWFAAAADSLAGAGPVRLAEVRDGGGRLAAIAPLVPVPGSRLPRTQVLGSRPLFEPTLLPHESDDALDELVSVLVGFGTSLHLGRLAAGSPELAAVRRLPRHRALVVERDDPGVPRLRLPPSVARLEGGLSRSRRSALRRARRRAEREGPVSIEVIAPPSREAPRHLDVLVEVERRSWKGRAGTALANDPAVRRFFERYARAMAERGDLRLSSLRIGGTTVAAQLAVERAGRLWVLKMGYDERWSACSPGALLTHGTICWAVERGLEAYEFLGTDAPWIRTWTDEVVPHRIVRLYPRSVRGAAALVGDGSAAAWRAVGAGARRLARRRDGEARRGAPSP